VSDTDSREDINSQRCVAWRMTTPRRRTRDGTLDGAHRDVGALDSRVRPAGSVGVMRDFWPLADSARIYLNYIDREIALVASPAGALARCDNTGLTWRSII